METPSVYAIPRHAPIQIQIEMTDRRIAHAEWVIAKQRGTIANMTRRGVDTIDARELLHTMLGILHEMRNFRRALVLRMGYQPAAPVRRFQVIHGQPRA